MTRLEKEKVLEKIYYDVEEGFGSVRDLYEKARKVDVGITLDMVSKWMRAQPNKQTQNYKNYNSYTAPFPKYEFQIDLMDVNSLLRDVGSEIKSQLRYGVVCIDIFSKKCHIVPIENKDGDDVYKSSHGVFQGIGSAFIHLQRRRRSVEQQETANILKRGRYNTRNNKDACKSGRKDDTHGQKNDWRQIEALQNQNMGGSAKALAE